MAQTYTADCYAAGHVGQTDLQNMETNFATLHSSFSGAAGPGNSEAGMPWYDTTKKILRFRDSGDANWLALIPGDANQKIWIYRNDTVEGMVVDATVTDRVLAVKGGSQAYNVNGGTLAGSYSHTHTGPSHTHTGPSHAHNITLPEDGWLPSATGYYGRDYSGAADARVAQRTIASAASGTGATGAAGTGVTGGSANQRPAAAVGTLQHPDI